MNQEREDRWVSTVCYMCYSCCGIKVRLVNGTVVEIAGHPDNPHNQGKLCAKGKAGIMSLYDPYRIRAPLLRTNAEKGIGVDPGFKEISWQEALEIALEKLSKVRREDPRKLVMAGLDFQFSFLNGAFASAFGTLNQMNIGANFFCGNGLHPVTYLTHGTFYAEPDFEHCNYCLLIGTQLGFVINTNAVTITIKMAEARSRGMKLVVVDPVGTNAAAKADEWIPIRPGTDSAFALALINLLVNEMDIFDREFLARHTNGSYLTGPDGHYLRERESNRPLVWDLAESRPKPYDGEEVKEVALEGTFSVGGQPALPAFQRLKEHVKKYTPEMAAAATTIPPEVIRRVAEEFGQAAQVGSKILIGGQELPRRPAVVAWNRGVAHKHALSAGLAIQLINIVVGAIDVPGGLLGTSPLGPFWHPKTGPDGLLVPADFHLVLEGAYPARRVRTPETVSWKELFPVACTSSSVFPLSMKDEKVLLPYKPEVLLHCQSNVMMSTIRPADMAQALKEIPFIISFAPHLDETVEFADLVFPDTHYLERLVAFPNRPHEYLAPGPGPWYWVMGQKAVQPRFLARFWGDVTLELAYGLGIGPDFNMAFNRLRHLSGANSLDPKKEYTWEEIVDIWARAWFGEERDLAWFERQYLLVTGQKSVEEAFPRPFLKARIPLYLEHLINAGQEVEQVTQRLSMNWDTCDYQPLPDWRPCPAYRGEPDQDDLYLVNFKWPFHNFSITPQNPWLNELSEHHPYAYRVLLPQETASSKGIKEGDLIWLESASGRVKGLAKPTECIHPEVVAVAGTFGHWAQGMPVAQGKGVHFNALLPLNLERMDLLSGAVDSCIRVKVYKA